jgi:hypothetical protein
MNRISTSLRSGFTVFVLLMVCFSIAASQAQDLGDPDTYIEYNWTAPQQGAEVDHYVLQILINEYSLVTVEDIPTEVYMLPVIYGYKYQMRVAAVSTAGKRGGFSGWSEPLNIEEYDDPPFNPG